MIVAGDDESGCLVPLDRLEDSGLAAMLQQLPGFDGRRLTEAVDRRPARPHELLGPPRLTPPF